MLHGQTFHLIRKKVLVVIGSLTHNSSSWIFKAEYPPHRARCIGASNQKLFVQMAVHGNYVQRTRANIRNLWHANMRLLDCLCVGGTLQPIIPSRSLPLAFSIGVSVRIESSCLFRVDARWK